MSVPPPRPRTVLHLTQALLPASETFIQQRLHGRTYAPTALAWEREPDGLSIPCPSEILRGGQTQRPPRRVASAARHGEMLRQLATKRPSVVHAHFGPSGLWVDRPCTLLGIPFVVTFYGYDAGMLPRNPKVAARYRHMFARAAAVTAEGPALARRLLELGARPETLKLLPLGLPHWALQAPQRAVPWNSQPLRLLQIARFTEKKGIDTTLRALHHARTQGSRAELLLVGGGELEPAIRTLIADLGLNDAVTLAGFAPHAELPALLSRAHLFVQPSRTSDAGDTEGGHPSTLLEAQAQQVPVLATRHADIPMAVDHGSSGWLVAEHDHEALGEAIVALDQDRQRLQAMGEAARVRVLRRHDPDRLLRLRERIYREAIRTYAARRRSWPARAHQLVAPRTSP